MNRTHNYSFFLDLLEGPHVAEPPEGDAGRETRELREHTRGSTSLEIHRTVLETDPDR